MTPQDASARLSKDASDGSLLAWVKTGNQEAATQLYLRYAQRLHALVRDQSSSDLARRVEADDIVQSVFRTFFTAASQGLYQVPAGEDLWKLLLVIALNKIRAQALFHNAAKRDVRRTTPIDGSAAEREAFAVKDDGDQVFLRMIIDEALEQLPPSHRPMVQLRLEGFEVAEIAQKTGRSKRTVERLLQEARKSLSALLQV